MFYCTDSYCEANTSPVANRLAAKISISLFSVCELNDILARAGPQSQHNNVH